MKKIRSLYWLPPAAAIFALAGCIVTGTLVITAKVAPDVNGDPIIVSNLDFSAAELEVDLSNDATFAEHRDDIKNIENVGFYLSAKNEKAFPVTFQLFLVPDTSKNFDSAQALVDSLALPILTDLQIPALSTVTIDWNESMQYVTNVHEFKDVLQKGVFSLYPAAIPRNDFKVVIDSLVVIVTLTSSD